MVELGIRWQNHNSILKTQVHVEALTTIEKLKNDENFFISKWSGQSNNI